MLLPIISRVGSCRGAQDDLLTIFQKAAELDKVMRESPDEYQIMVPDYGDYGRTLDPETMERVDGIPEVGGPDGLGPIDLLVVPGLVRMSQMGGGWRG